ncbi:bis(5'-nucleosyl)-tetraphosphatase (symmetrical) YqeK, partial [Ruminococcaceae bacterium OttesenSCG-928-O06]|nr:bis(5'-nucleosyl)-tetraphosphatase (symmetrical) YqeK [Ruminococcaceae bacterium OttesenSCG-928-O06]
MTLEQAQQHAKQTLSDKRYRHTQGVVAQAKALAQRWGADAEKAQLAAWLHDIAKERSRAELLQLVEQGGIMSGSLQARPLPVWHGPCGAEVARQLGVQDEEVLSAIACHTTGKAGMSRLDKVVLLADAISEDRCWPGVEALRRLAYEDLDEAVVLALESTLQNLQKQGETPDGETQKALRDLRRNTQ